jgi:hypothetical protein
VAIEPELVNRAIREISKRRANYDYFFERLSSPDWIEPLAEHGLFDNPPPPEADENGVFVPPWPPSRYLARMVSLAPERVLSIMLRTKTSNERVHEDFAEAAAAMPRQMRLRWARSESEWLRQTDRLYYLLPEKLVDLIEKLVQDGEVEAAVALTRELFRPLSERFEAAGRWNLAAPRFRIWAYRRLLDRAVSPILERQPEAALRLLVDLLTDAVNRASSEFGPYEDLSQVWRPRVANDEKADRDVLQCLVSTLRDAATTVRERVAVTDIRLVQLLLHGETKVFRRIALFALAKDPAPDVSVLAGLLVDPGTFNEPEPNVEYRELLSKAFGLLGLSEQLTILRWISDGPKAEALPQQTDEGSFRSDALQRAATWRIRRLNLIEKYLSPEWVRRREKLVEQFGDSEFITSFEVTAWWGPKSPVNLEELSARSDDELVGLLETYEQPNDWIGPSREGLARTLSEMAEGDSERISGLAPRLAGVRPLYIYWVLIGLAAAIRDGKSVQWHPLLELLEISSNRPEDDIVDRDEDEYGRWSWVRKEIAGVLEAGFRSSTSAPPFELRHRGWGILRPITDDPEPTPEYEERYGGTNMDPATLALNTTRGRAMHAAIGYALWMKRNRDARDPDSTPFGFDAMPEVREVLEQHLVVERDPSIAVRAVYGQTFPWLALLDEQWATNAKQRIFPDDASHSVLREAAWSSYVIFCPPYNSIFGILRDQYASAVERLRDARPPWRWIGGSATQDERLAEHLLTFYWRGLIDLNDEGAILEHLFDNASSEVCAYAVEFIGRNVQEIDSVPVEPLRRLQDFWEWRIGVAEAQRTEARQIEVASFSWMADADVIPSDWRISQLERVLQIGGSLRHEQVVLSAMSKLANLYPRRAVRVLRLFLEREKRGWTIGAAQDEILSILRTCKESGDPDTLELVDATAHWLGSLGYSGFRNIVGRTD